MYRHLYRAGNRIGTANAIFMPLKCKFVKIKKMHFLRSKFMHIISTAAAVTHTIAGNSGGAGGLLHHLKFSRWCIAPPEKLRTKSKNFGN